jgi:all-trans-retinol 13,14-reductase
MSRRAVVVGAGMGGLTAAVLLQANGYDVTVLEQHTRPGGLLHRFFRGGVPYDTGFHYCGSVDAGQPLGQALRHLGVWDDLVFRPLDPDGFDRLRFPGEEIRVPVGIEAYAERLKQRFPAEACGVDAFFADVARAIEPYGLYRMRHELDIDGILRAEEVSVQQVLDRHLREPKLKAALTAQAMLYGVPPAEAPFGLHAIVLDHFLAGAYTVEGGGDKLARVMARRVRALGGTVRLRADVARIEVDGRKATGVVLADGEVVPADVVVANVHPRAVVEMLPPGAVRPAYRSRVRDAAVGVGHLGVYIELDEPARCIGNANVYRLASWDLAGSMPLTRPGAVPLYYAGAPGEHGPDGRHHRHTVLMVLPLDWALVAPWAGTEEGARPAAYRELKQALLDSAVDALLADFPALRGHVVRAEASTPLATARYVRSPDGAMYGHYHSVAQMGRYRPSQGTRVTNLVLVGQGVGFPGILGVTLSAYHAVGSVLDHDAGANMRTSLRTRLIEELRSA